MSGSKRSTYHIWCRSFYVLFFVFLMSQMACISDGKSDCETMQGKWKLKNALRNNKITHSLDGVYLNFRGEHAFDSNITGDTSSFNSIIFDRKIKIEHDLLTSFDIVELSDSIMKLETEINDDELFFVFIR